MSEPQTPTFNRPFIIFPILAALFIITMMGLVISLTPGGLLQSLGFVLQSEETQLSSVTDWQNVQVAGGAARLQLPQVLQKQGDHWVLNSAADGEKGVYFGTAWAATGAGWSSRTMLPAPSERLDESPTNVPGLEATSYTLKRAGHLEQHVVIAAPNGAHALDVYMVAPNMNTLQGLEPTFGTALRSVTFSASSGSIRPSSAQSVGGGAAGS